MSGNTPVSYTHLDVYKRQGEYEHLYALKGVTCQDIDGDGLKDIVILADYSYEGSDGGTVVEGSYAIYYQRTGGFFEDTDMKQTLILEEGEDVYKRQGYEV